MPITISFPNAGIIPMASNRRFDYFRVSLTRTLTAYKIGYDSAYLYPPTTAAFPVGASLNIYDAQKYAYYIDGVGARPSSYLSQTYITGNAILTKRADPFLLFNSAPITWSADSGAFPASGSERATANGKEITLTLATRSWDITNFQNWLISLGLFKGVDYYLPNPPTENDDATIDSISPLTSNDFSITSSVSPLFDGDETLTAPYFGTVVGNGRAELTAEASGIIYRAYVLYDWRSQTYSTGISDVGSFAYSETL